MGEGGKGSLREFNDPDALQICLFQLVLEPERLRVLRLRRCPDLAFSPSRFIQRDHYNRNLPRQELLHMDESISTEGEFRDNLKRKYAIS